MTDHPRLLSPLAYWLALIRLPFLRGTRREELRARIIYSRELYERRAAHRRFKRQLAAEAKIYQELIRERLAGLGYMWAARYRYDQGNNAGSKKTERTTFKVGFERCYTSDYLIRFKVRVRERTLFATKNALPHMVTVGDLVHEDTTRELSFACERIVTAAYNNPRCGAWYQVHRLEGIGLVPNLVKWRDLLEHYPQDIASIPWVVGIGERRIAHTINLAGNPHMLIAGPTLSGKSVAVNGFICGLMYYTHPRDLQFLLIDLKEGVEFQSFVNAPHLCQPIVRKREEALAALQSISEEIDRRLNLLREAEAKDLPSYNAKQPETQRLPILIVVIDEYAQLVIGVSKKDEQAANSLVTRIGALGRAPGIQIVVCTQYPTAEVLNRQVKINLNHKLAFRTQNSTQSLVILDDARAAMLDPKVKGRIVHGIGADFYEAQVGHCLEEDIQHVLKVARGRVAGLTNVDGTTITINPAGAARMICEAFEGRIVRSKLITELTTYGPTRVQVGKFVDDLEHEAPAGYHLIHEEKGSRLEPDKVETNVQKEDEEDTEEVRAVNVEIFEDTTVLDFLKARCIPAAGNEAALNLRLYLAYRQWAGEKALNIDGFEAGLRQAGYERDGQRWPGIRLREAAQV